MKTALPFVVFRLAALIVAVAFLAAASGANAVQDATTAPSGKIAKVGKKKAIGAAAVVNPTRSTGANEIGMLDKAYGLLRVADHDYKGHRARAMHQIEDAVRELGSKVSGGGKAGEKQGESDSQVRSAQSLLQEAVGGIAGKAHRHVEEALKQLGIALTIK